MWKELESWYINEYENFANIYSLERPGNTVQHLKHRLMSAGYCEKFLLY